MKRRPEPELMDRAEQAIAYAQADFRESNELFMQLLAELEPRGFGGATALDLGCGTADIVLRFLKRYPRVRCHALDGSQAMIDLARDLLDRHPDVADRARLLCDLLPSPQLPALAYDVILSNSLLHHLHDPQVLWRTIKATAKPGAPVLIMDLTRPASAGWVEALVSTYAAGEPEVLVGDFRASLFAAFEPQEVAAQLREAGLDDQLDVNMVSNRHLAVMGHLRGSST